MMCNFARRKMIYNMICPARNYIFWILDTHTMSKKPYMHTFTFISGGSRIRTYETKKCLLKKRLQPLSHPSQQDEGFEPLSLLNSVKTIYYPLRIFVIEMSAPQPQNSFVHIIGSVGKLISSLLFIFP